MVKKVKKVKKVKRGGRTGYIFFFSCGKVKNKNHNEGMK